MSSNEIEEAMKAAEECVTAHEAEKASEEIPLDLDDSAAVVSQEDLDEIKELLAQKDDEIAQLKNDILLAQANLENFRKRAEKELNESRKYAAGKVLTDFLPVMDNCKRAVEHLPKCEDEPFKTMATGLKMIQDNFLATLKKHGVEPIESLGKSFDPNIHEALTQMPSADYEPGQICQVFEDGYMINDRLLRAAKVVVACAMPETASNDSEDKEST